MTWGHRLLPFPESLTPGQRRCIEAVQRTGTFRAAAAALGLSEKTVNQHVDKARQRAGVTTTADLLTKLAEIERSHS